MASAAPAFGGKSAIGTILADATKLQELSDSLFKTIDTSGNGYINKKEYKTMVAKIASESGNEAPSDEEYDAVWNDALSHLDKDDDGRINSKEFLELTRSILTAFEAEM